MRADLSSLMTAAADYSFDRVTHHLLRADLLPHGYLKANYPGRYIATVITW